MDESHFRMLKELARDGTLSQRDLSARVGLSLGRVNYIVRSLIEKGFIKASRFKNSRNKLAYAYVLTPKGLKKRIELARALVELKQQEYEQLRREIEELRNELGEDGSGGRGGRGGIEG